MHPNSLRYAAATGTVVIRWAGARAPTIWTVPAPDITSAAARVELARRYLHVFGPTTADSFTKWAGIGRAQGRAAFDELGASLAPVRSPIGDAWILVSDEEAIRAPEGPAAPARLLPSGDAYFLLWGADRELLVPDAGQRAALWTSRVWPGAVWWGSRGFCVASGAAVPDGQVVGTWRRDGASVTVETWRSLAPHERAQVEAEAASLPTLPDLAVAPVRLPRWRPTDGVRRSRCGGTVSPGQFMHAWVSFARSSKVAVVMLGLDLPEEIRVPGRTRPPWNMTLVTVEIPPDGWVMP